MALIFLAFVAFALFAGTFAVIACRECRLCAELEAKIDRLGKELIYPWTQQNVE